MDSQETWVSVLGLPLSGHVTRGMALTALDSSDLI